MISLILFALTGILSGIASVFIALIWSWDWFGDIWHQNHLSSQWHIPIMLIWGGNWFCVWLSPRIFHGLSIHWGHYLSVSTGLVIGTGIAILYLRAH